MSTIFQRVRAGPVRGGQLPLICHYCKMRLGSYRYQVPQSLSPMAGYFQMSEVGSITDNGSSSNKHGKSRLFTKTLATAGLYSCFSCIRGSGAKTALTPLQNFHLTSSAAASIYPPSCANLSKTICRDISQQFCKTLIKPFSTSSLCNFQRTLRVHADAHTKSDAVVQDKYVAELSDALLAGERWALARAITLVEATHKKGKKQAQVLLRKVLDHLRDEQLKNKGVPSSFRIGLTGPPGAGKSTFIEAMGKKLTTEGHRVAVLAVDPSSSITGGSLLGDKTRMTELSRDPSAYIRASPSSGTLGGVARNTNDAILLCEASGYDVIIVETIGVGQSEYVVADMVDMLVLLVPPAGGDELQGLKKGIVERADFILVNKADGELLIPARRMRSEYTSAVKLMYKRSPLWTPKVKQVSAKTGDGMSKAWDTMNEYRSIMIEAGEFRHKRQLQRRVWMWQHIKEKMMEEFKENHELQADIRWWEEEVMSGRCTAGIASDELLKRFSQITKDI